MLSIIKSPYLISFTGNPVAFTFAITPYRDAELKKDYKIIVRVEVEEIFNSNSFAEVKELQLYPEESGCATISIEKILNSFLQQYLPRFTQDVIVPLTEQCKRYRLTYRLINGTSLVQSPVTSSIFYALRGGLSYQEWNPKKFFTQKLAVDKTFLRFPVTKEYVFKDEYKFLSWISSLDETNEQSLYVIIGYSDGTQSDPSLLKSVTVPAWQPCTTAAGWTQLNLDAIADATKTPVWYELLISSGEVCIPVTVPAFTLPDAVQDVAYSFTIPIYGTSITAGAITAPSWLTVTVGTNNIIFSGTPGAGDVGVTGNKAIKTYSITAPGSAYTDGSYSGVTVYNTTGPGTGATANVTVSGGVVTVFTIVDKGENYEVDDVVYCNSADIGGTGTGMQVQVSEVSSNVISFELSNACSGGIVTTNTTINVLDSARETAWRIKTSTAYCVSDGSGYITGYQGWTTLEEYFTDDNTAVIPASTKANSSGDPDYVAPIENLEACPIGIHFIDPSIDFSDTYNENETANISGIPSTSCVVQLSHIDNSSSGTIKVNGLDAYLNETWTVALNGSGNGSIPVALSLPEVAGIYISVYFNIISVTSGTIGTPNYFQIIKSTS